MAAKSLEGFPYMHMCVHGHAHTHTNTDAQPPWNLRHYCDPKFHPEVVKPDLCPAAEAQSEQWEQQQYITA